MNAPPLLKQPCLPIRRSLPALIHSSIRSSDAVRRDAGRSADEPSLVPLESPRPRSLPAIRSDRPSSLSACGTVAGSMLVRLVPCAHYTGRRRARGRQDRPLLRVSQGTAMLFRHDVFHVESNQGRCQLRKTTISACVAGPGANETASSLVPSRSPAREKTAGLCLHYGT